MSGLFCKAALFLLHTFIKKSLHVLNILVMLFSARDGSLEVSTKEGGAFPPSLTEFHYNLSPSRITLRELLGEGVGRVIFLLYLIIQNRINAWHGVGVWLT